MMPECTSTGVSTVRKGAYLVFAGEFAKSGSSDIYCLLCEGTGSICRCKGMRFIAPAAVDISHVLDLCNCL